MQGGRQLNRTNAQPTPERESLRRAIAQHTEAMSVLNRISEAREHARQVGTQALVALKSAKVVFDNARSSEGHRLTAVAIGAPDDTISVADAQFVVTQAENDLAVARRTSDALTESESAAAAEVERCKRIVDAAVSDVVKSDISMQKLVAEHDEAKLRLANLAVIFNYLSEQRCNPLSRWGYDEQAASPRAADHWKGALSALRIDADAALPNE